MILEKSHHFTTTKWNGKMHFESSVNGHIIHIDKLHMHGGEDKGPRPKLLILSAIAGCAGMEIISVLEKMRVKIEDLQIDVTGELNDELPKIYKSVRIVFAVKSLNSDTQKIARAIQLTTEKYCGVLEMVRHFAIINSEIKFL